MTPQRQLAERTKTVEFLAPAKKSDRKRVYAPAEEDARQLQARAQAWAVGRSLDGDAAGKDKWSPRKTLAFTIGASLLLWGGAYLAGWLLINSL